MKRLLLIPGLCFMLSGCASNPEQFSNHVNDAVNNVHTAAVASVSIGTDVLGALVSLMPAFLNLLGAI